MPKPARTLFLQPVILTACGISHGCERLPEIAEYQDPATRPGVMEKAAYLLACTAQSESLEPQARDIVQNWRFEAAQITLGGRVDDGFASVMRENDACLAIIDVWDRRRALTKAIESLHSIPPEEWSLAHIKAYHEVWGREGGEQENRRAASEREMEIWERIIEAREKGEPPPSELELDWGGLNLSETTETLFALGDALGKLDLSANKITALPDRIGDLTALTMLDLSGNNLTTLPDRTGELTALTWLDLSNNEITALSDCIADLQELEELYLSNNQITVLPDRIGDLRALKQLYLSNNRLTFLPDRIGDLSVLEELYLSDNRITVVPERIGDLQEMQWLDLADNALERLPNGMGSLGRHATVVLSGNPIAMLPTNIHLWNRFEVNLNAGGLSEVALAELTQLIREQVGPRINYNMTQAGAVQTVAGDRARAAPFYRAAAAWLPLDIPDRAANLDQLERIDKRYQTEVEDAQAILTATSSDDASAYYTARGRLIRATDNLNRMREFSRLLDRLPEIAEYKNRETRPSVMGKVEYLLTCTAQAESLDPKARDIVQNMRFDAAQTALGTCGDRVGEGFASVMRKNDACLSISEDWSIERRLTLIEAEWLNEQIDAEVEVRTRGRGGDPVEIALGYKMRLADEKGMTLPYLPKEILYDICAKVSDTDLDTMWAHLQGLDRGLLVEYTARHEIWKDYLEQHHPEASKVIDQGFEVLMEALEDPWDFKEHAHPGMPEALEGLIATETFNRFVDATMKEPGRMRCGR